MRENEAARLSSRHLPPVELECSWCGDRVPLPAGDFSGVCIACGTVMFRHSWFPAQLPRPEFEQYVRSIEEYIGGSYSRRVSLPAV